MAKYLEVYKCELCGNIVEVFDGGARRSCVLRPGHGFDGRKNSG